jgi:hypothetical protein
MLQEVRHAFTSIICSMFIFRNVEHFYWCCDNPVSIKVKEGTNAVTELVAILVLTVEYKW